MQQNAEKQLSIALSKFKLARDWVAINGCIQNIKEVCLTFRDEIYETPHILLLSKTLSQCLSPSLPAGVQSSALDVYSLIFETAGENRLLRDFYIWAPGILQFFHSAGVSQRVSTLKLFSDFFIPLIPNNHRIGPPIILSILPGLTDDGTEVQSLDYQSLETIKRYLGSIQFWRAMFRSAITHPNTRSAFLAFSAKNDPFSEFHDIHNKIPNEKESQTKENNNDDLNDSKLVVSLFTSLFNDANFLIVRSALELFKSSFPKFLSDEVKSDLSLKCFNLLSNDNKSIRRRVFQWITENIDSKIVHKSAAKAEPEAVKASLEKGDEIKKMIVDNCLVEILARGTEFDISIFFASSSENSNILVDLETLYEASSKISSLNIKDKTKFDLYLLSIEAQLRIAQNSLNLLSAENKTKFLINTLNKFIELNKIETSKKNKDVITLKLAELSLLLLDSADSDQIKNAGENAINSIFSNFKNISQCLSLSYKLLLNNNLDCNFYLLVQTTDESQFSFSSIDLLVKLSKTNLSALITLDENSDKCITYCWQLLSILASNSIDFINLSELEILEKKIEICKILNQLYYSYSSVFTINLDKNWDPSSILFFINYSTEIPLPVLIVSQNKINSMTKAAHFDNFNLLRMICGHSQLLLSDAQRLLTAAFKENDFDYMNIIIKSLIDLVNIDKILFVKSISDSSLINFVSLLLSFNSISSNLIYSILSVNNSGYALNQEVLTKISSLIENYVLSNVNDSFSFRLLIPVSLYLQDSSLSAFIDLVPKHPSMLNALISILEQIPSSDSHYVFLDSLYQRCIELLNNIQTKSFLLSYFDENPSNSFVPFVIDEPFLNDISRLFKLIISRTENEILENRATVKSSTLRRILTSVEDLSNDNCIASLTVSYIQDDANARYSSLSPKYLPQILDVAFNSLNIISIKSSANLLINSDGENNFLSSFFLSKFIIPLFLSFDDTWKLLFFYALSVTNNKRMMQCVVSAIIPLVSDNQMAYYFKSLIQVLSYNDNSEKFDVSLFCSFVETLLYLRTPVFSANAEQQSQPATSTATNSNMNAASSSPSTSNPENAQSFSTFASAGASSIQKNVLSLLSNIQPSSTISTSTSVANPPIEILPIFSSMFTQLHISSLNIIKLILNYQINFPQVSLSALQVPFMNALSDSKLSQDDLRSIISFLCNLENKEAVLKKSLFKSNSQGKATLVLTKMFSLCDKNCIQYPLFISKFSSFDLENTDWATSSIINMLSDPQFFQNGINYLVTSMEAIKSVSLVASEKLVPLLFELFSKTSSDTGLMWIQMRSSSLGAEGTAIRNLKLLSFSILSCDFDFFANKQQNISQQLLQFLSILEGNNNSAGTSSVNIASSSNSNTLNLSPLNGGTNSFIKNFVAFKAFVLFMKVMFLRFSSKFLEFFLPIITNELTLAFASDDDNIMAQAEVLLRSAIVTIPALFQFTEFAFIPDLITFPNNGDLAQNQRSVWPIIKESTDSLLHLTQPGVIKKSNIEFDILREFLENVE